MVSPTILESINDLVSQFIAFVPKLVAIVILILLGWFLGKYIGKIGAKILDKIGLDDLIEKTAVGGMIKKAEMSTVGLFESLIKGFIYLIFAVIIIDMLQIQVVAEFITALVSYIPLIFSAIVVLIIGLLIVDFITNIIRKVIVAMGVDDKIMQSSIGEPIKTTGMTISGIISGIIKLFGYLIFFMAATDILKLTRLSIFLNDVLLYLPNLFIGILILIIGFLSIDFIADSLQSMMKGMNVESSEVILPLIRAFMFLVVLLLALDSMLINTSIFYSFIGPIAWGFAVVVAFKWGVKEAIVAYAREKK